MEALVKSGAMDTLPGTRHQKMAVLDKAIAGGHETQKARESGQNSLFDILGGGPANSPAQVSSIVFPVVDEGPEAKREYVAWEKELLGMPITEDPIMQMMLNAPHDPGRITLSQITKQHIGTSVRLLGMVSHTKRLTTKKGDAMLVGQIDDADGSIEFVAFPKTYTQYAELLVDDAVLQITAKVDQRSDSLQLMLDNVATFDVKAAADKPGAAGAKPPAGVIRVASSYAAPSDIQYPPADFDGMPLPEEPGDDNWDYQEVGMTVASNGNNGHGRAVTQNGNGAAPPAAVQRVPSAQNGNGDGAQGYAGNGNGNGNGHAAPAPASGPSPEAQGAVSIVPRPRRRVTLATPDASGVDAPPPTATGPRFHLHVYLNRTDNLDLDIKHMQEIDRLLRGYQGEQTLTLYMPYSLGQVMLEAGYGITPAEPLMSTLHNLLGQSNVVLEQI
jgi:DNA polymerase-3 subunit alpha